MTVRDVCLSETARYEFRFFPGSPAGFSWVRSRKRAFIPLASDTAPSPNRSRNRSAAESAWFHFSCADVAQQAELLTLLVEMRRMHSQQPHRLAIPVRAEEFANRG